jgi:hypothetical protein
MARSDKVGANDPAALRPPKPPAFLRVAVTGHRPKKDHALDVGKVTEACKDVFDDLAACLATSDSQVFAVGAPVLALVSPLAEGADQIAAEALFSREESSRVRRRLEVVLPFGVEAYAGAFDDPKAAQAMRGWLGKAETRMILSDWTPPVGDADPLAAYWRDERYATLGSVLLDEADVLIAIWDGLPARGRGGAADVVIEAITRRIPVIWIAPVDGTIRLLMVSPAYQDVFQMIRRGAPILDRPLLEDVLAPLLSPPLTPPAHGDGDELAGSAELIRYLEREAVPKATRWSIYHNVLVLPARRGLFRRGGQGKTPPMAEFTLGCDHVAQDFANPDWTGMPAGAGAFGRARSTLSEAWSAADAIGTRLGHIYRSIYVLIFGLGALAVAIGLMALVLGHHSLFATAEFAILFLAWRIYAAGKDQKHHKRLIAARELSEQVRAHWGAALLGLAGRRRLAADAPWTAWLFNAYVGPTGAPDLDAGPRALRDIAVAVRDGVVRAQQAYHQRNADGLFHIHRRLERWGLRVLMLALLSSATLAVTTFMLGEAKPSEPPEGWLPILMTVLMVMNGALPALGAALAGLRYQGDFERFSDRSRETFAALGQIDQALERFIADADRDAPLEASEPPLFEQLRAIVLNLRDVLLADVEDWRFVYVARPSPEPG